MSYEKDLEGLGDEVLEKRDTKICLSPDDTKKGGDIKKNSYVHVVIVRGQSQRGRQMGGRKESCDR